MFHACEVVHSVVVVDIRTPVLCVRLLEAGHDVARIVFCVPRGMWAVQYGGSQMQHHVFMALCCPMRRHDGVASDAVSATLTALPHTDRSHNTDRMSGALDALFETWVPLLDHVVAR